MINLDDLTNGFWFPTNLSEADQIWLNWSGDLRTRHGRPWRRHIDNELAEVGAVLIEFGVNLLDENEEWEWLIEVDVQRFVKFESPEAYSMFRLRWS